MTITESHSRSFELADPVLLEKIDKLFACNVGEYISLPQLVVVGDQSSGKSSVLEGLTKLNFPRDSGLCTRFATQIIFRRDSNLVEREISASIIPSSDATPEEDQKLRGWKASALQSLNSQDFGHTMKEVHEVMNLSSSHGDQRPTFSNSVLQLEIRGPNENHLSVIDVPGIFKNTTLDRTTKNDIALVRNMVLRYMQNQRSIMLAVVPANVDIATQEIIEMASEIDPEGGRTLRILTKPDLVDKGAEQNVIRLIHDGNLNGQLGWILVRNLGQQQLQAGDVDRDAEERLFHQNTPWNRVPPENYGISALMVRLQELLTSNVRREFPSVRSEVIKRLKDSKSLLQSLGVQRETAEQQRRILLDVVSGFQEITQQALATNYGVNDMFDEDKDLRLATLVSLRNDVFSHNLAHYGHTYTFRSKPEETDDSVDDRQERRNDAADTESQNVMQSRKSWDPTRDTSVEDLGEILHVSEPVEPSIKGGILPWIEGVYSSSRGFEIGTFNHTLLSTLMKKQSVKWSILARGYISDIISVVHAFIRKALEVVSKDLQISSSIMSLLMDDLIEKYQQAISTVDFLLRIEREGTPITFNHYFNDNLEKCRQKRLHSTMAKKSFKDCKHGEVVRLSDLAHQHHMSNVDHTVQDIQDILDSYYKVARKRFVDNVCMQASDHYLVTGPEAPMKLFSPSWVNDLSNERLEEIVGEGRASKRRRLQLQKEIDDLEAGKAVLLR
ncbi:Dynamin [Penicillium expansum]|uniref:Dynamin n=1 Tax=Penicillium expansum TaxID=27334 RepID=A0A0A2JJH2_PENEN|nr:Dynamin [Penicillium expansum]KGO54813.1 Dynamin [Penicillium expansum]